ncbi:argininosuccinate lyase [Bacillus manliponensis]|uniref:argininosuccinate lyase n=1 Tax=Bacillus manliponensis TaxID=574376 RepID=UPI00351135FF
MRGEHIVGQESEKFPGKVYADCVLKHVFQFQRDYLLRDMLLVHRAHTIMLQEEGIIKESDAKLILGTLKKVETISSNELTYETDYEDLFFLIEHHLQKEANSDAISNMHIGKSRNDMGVALYRMSLRRDILRFAEHFMLLRESILHIAKEHIETIMPAYTHTQPAQPTTFGHYMLAIYDQMERDAKRVWRAYDAVNQSPLGAAALSTTGFPINRERVAALLGFSNVIENSYDAIASADYLLETSAALMITMTNSSRWIQDFLLLATKEYSGITVADAYVQISSIMPQKRNPVSIEHARALSSSSFGEAFTTFQMIHNTPFGDIVDTEDDLQPHLYASFEKGIRVCCVMNAVIRTLKVEKAILQERAAKHAITITELADVLAGKYNVPFRQAHHVASLLATMTVQAKKELYEWKLVDINKQLQNQLNVILTEEEWRDIVSPRAFIAKRNVYGGPSKEQMERMVKERIQQFEREEHQLEKERKRIRDIESELNKNIK